MKAYRLIALGLLIALAALASLANVGGKGQRSFAQVCSNNCAPSDVPGTASLNGISCPVGNPIAGGCLAVGSNLEDAGAIDVPVGVVVPLLTNGSAGAAIPVAGTSVINSFAFTGSGNGFGMGQSANGTAGVTVPLVNGTPGAAGPLLGVGIAKGIACPSSTNCFVVGQSSTGNMGVIVTLTNGAPGPAVPVGGTSILNSIDCTSSGNLCVAVGQNSSGTTGVLVPIASNGVSGAVTVPGTTALESVSAATLDAFVMVGSSGKPGASGSTGVEAIFNFGSGSQVGTVAGTNVLDGVACAGTACFVVGSSGPTGAAGTVGVVGPLGGTSPAATPTPTPTATVKPGGPAITYPAGYNLVGGPSGTVEQGAIFSLLTQQAGDSKYEVSTPATPLQAPRAYWAFFPTTTTVNLPLVTAQATLVTLPADQFIMVGNPLDVPVTATGADIIDTFNASTQNYTTVTAGPVTIPPGQGAWVFSFNGSPLTLTP